MHPRNIALVVGLPLLLTSCDADQAPDPDEAGTEPLAHPPERPRGAPPGDGPGTIFAVTRLFVGTTGMHGGEDPDAWKTIGYDLDGLASDGSPFEHCLPRDGAKAANLFADGVAGIDNGFGKNLLPIIKTGYSLALPDLDAAIQASVAARETGLLFRLGDLGGGSDYDPIRADVFEARLGASGGWAAAARSVAEPHLPPDLALAGAHLSDPSSYVAAGEWVFAPTDPEAVLSLRLAPLPDIWLDLRIRRPLITMKLPSGPGEPARGTIAGILDPEEVRQEGIRAFDLLVEECKPGVRESVGKALAQAAEIRMSGVMDDTHLCDGISLGLAFEAEPIDAVDGIAPVEPAVEVHCQ